MKAMLKGLPYFLLSAFILAGAIATFEFEYGLPASRRGLRSLEVTDHPNSQPAIVSIDGILFGSGESVYGVKQLRFGHRVLIFVMVGLARDGHRNGSFHCDVVLSDEINGIAFNNPYDLIWWR